MPISVSQTDTLLQACSVLFGSDLALTPEFLDYIQLSGVKSAYRLRAKETHPDMVRAGQGEGADQSAHRFLVVEQSYRELCRFLTMRNAPVHPSPSPREPAGSNQSGSTLRSHSGSLPQRRLRLGEFFYHNGMCNWVEISRALAWQHRSRPRIGELGCDFGWLGKEDILKVFRHSDKGSPFGETAIGLGLLNRNQLQRLLTHQQLRQPKFGQYFLRHRKITRQQLLDALWLLSRHNFFYPER